MKYTERRPEHPEIKGQTSSGRYTLPKILGNTAAEQVILEVKRDAFEELVLADMRGQHAEDCTKISKRMGCQTERDVPDAAFEYDRLSKI